MSLSVTTPVKDQLVQIDPQTHMARITVSGTATGTRSGGSEPEIHDITDVTVQIDTGQTVDAKLTKVSQLEVTFTVDVSLATIGQHVITVTAIDDMDHSVAQQVPVVVAVDCRPGVPWSNWAGNAGIARGTVTPASTCTPSSLADIIAVVQQAEANNMHVHAFGSKWDFSDCAITRDVLLDMRHLNRPIQSVQQALTAGVPNPDLIFHVEAGITIKDLYTILDNPSDSKALETMPGSASMTLGGAISTGSHGSDKSFELLRWMPPVADSVLAIHLVGAGGMQYWIEPTSGITDSALLQKFVVPGIDPKNIIYDDSTFETVLVSLGCIGIIYAVVLRVRGQYGLIETTTASTWSRFKGDAVAKYFNDPNNRFLEVAIDPYADSNGDNQCLVITRQEGDVTDLAACTAVNLKGALTQAVTNMVQDMINVEPTPPPIPFPPLPDVGSVFPGSKAWQVLEMLQRSHDAGQDVQGLIKVINFILEQAPELRPTLVQDYRNIMTAWQPAGTCGGLSYTVMNTELRGATGPTIDIGGYSIEMSFPALDSDGKLAFAPLVDDIINTISRADTTFLGGWIAIRFTGATRAALGMQQWGLTCAIEISTLPGIDGELALLETLYELMLEHRGLPHWGQLIDLTVPGHGSMYPRFGEWRNVYAKFSQGFQTRTFENDLSTRWQLTSPTVTMPVPVPDFTGDTPEQATATANLKNLKLKFTGPDPTKPLPGWVFTVVDQDPKPPVAVPPGWVVTVVVEGERKGPPQ